MARTRESLPTVRVSELLTAADAALSGGDHIRALGLYAAISEVQPTNLHVRMRIGDALLAMSDVQRAAKVYMALARHAAFAGHPLRAVVATKVLATLEPTLGQLLDDIAKLYGRESSRLGASVRSALPDADELVPADARDRWLQDVGVLETATEQAVTYRASDWVYPDKLMPIPLLSILGIEEFAAALHAVKLVRAYAGQIVIEQGQPGTSFFVLARGTVRVTLEDSAGQTRELATLAEGSIFGEMALLTSAPRTATVSTVGDADLLEFDRDALAAASKTARRLGEALKGFAQDRLLKNVMRSSGVFQPLDQGQRQALMRHFVAVNAEQGDQIIKQGEPGTGLYVVLRGQVVVTRQGTDRVTELARLGVGEMFGEIAILNDSPTTASVHATEPSAVLFLGRTYVERLMEGVPEIREHIERLGEERILDTFRRARTDPPPSDEEDEIEIFI